MPECYPEEHLSRAHQLVQPATIEAVTEYLKLIIYQLSNNMAEGNWWPEVVSILRHTSLLKVCLNLQITNSPTLAAFAGTPFGSCLSRDLGQRQLVGQ
jgi:hypothetical protein